MTKSYLQISYKDPLIFQSYKEIELVVYSKLTENNGFISGC